MTYHRLGYLVTWDAVDALGFMVTLDSWLRCPSAPLHLPLHAPGVLRGTRCTMAFFYLVTYEPIYPIFINARQYTSSNVFNIFYFSSIFVCN
jgi:hypothetical protein